MKKFLNPILICICIIICLASPVKANSTTSLELTVTRNKEHKEFELYMLLPEKYIKYAINESDLEIEYKGAETLKENEIPLINIDKNKVQEETYNEADIEYVQILLEPDNEDVYRFEIIADYPALDMKFRIKNNDKDYIMHIDNFKIEDNVCKIEYDYDKNEIKQPKKIVINSGALLLMIILILIIIIAIISKYKVKYKK